MRLHPAQSQIASDTHRFRVINCGRRFGKTTLAVLEMVGKALYGKDRNICYIAPTYQQARDIAWQELKKICQPVKDNINESRLEIRIKTVDSGLSTISLRGWESIETLRGQAFDFIVIDEVASMRNFWPNWQEVIRPTLTDRKGETMFISTPKGFNHFYDLYNFKDEDYKSFHFTSYDNPFLPKEELDKARKEIPEDQFAQEYMADFRKMEGLVYKEFVRERHVFSDSELAKKARLSQTAILIGIDWGYTNPCAILKAYKDYDNHYWFTEEYYKAGKTDDEIKEYAKSLQGTHYYPDPAEPDRCESLRRLGLNVRDVSKDVEAGISVVRALFKENRIHIHSSLVNLISELETYRYGEKKPDKNEPEEPVKEHDHAVDALRYMLYMQAAQPVNQKSKHFIPSSHVGGANRGMSIPK